MISLDDCACTHVGRLDFAVTGKENFVNVAAKHLNLGSDF